MGKSQGDERSGGGTLSFLLGAVIGAVAGTVSWILLAPRELKEKAEEESETLKEKTKDAASGTTERLSEAKDTAMYIAEGVGEVISEYAVQGKEYLSEQKENAGRKLGEAYEAGKDAFLRRKSELEDEKEQ